MECAIFAEKMSINIQRVSFDLESVWGKGESMGGIVTDGRNNTEQVREHVKKKLAF